MKKILVIRKFDKFSQILIDKGFEVINLPLIETVPIEDLSDFENKLKTLENYDGIFLTSKVSTQIFAEKLDELNISFSGKVYVLGKRSFDILQTKNLDLIYFEEANTADEMLQKISIDELRDKNFLYIRGEKSLRKIPNFLKNIAELDESIVYQTEQNIIGIDTILEISNLIEASEIETICFFSPSGAESFIEKFGKDIFQKLKVAVIGETTADFMELQNLKVDFISSKSNAESFAFELIENLQNGKRKMENEKS